PAGVTSFTVSISSTEDTIDESNENYVLTVGGVNGTGTITDDDNAPDVSIGDASATEGGDISFPITLSNPSSEDITLTFSFTNGTAEDGDYTTIDVQITILAGDTTGTVVVPTTADTIDEGDETFTVGISSVDTGTVGTTTDTAIGTIIDDDNAPDISIGDASATEGGDVSFPITLSNPSSEDITLTFSFTNGTAEDGDYTTTDVQITILAGDTTGTVVVPTTADTIDEGDETFTVGISSVDSGTVGTTTDTATGTIIDDDDTSQLTLTKTAVASGAQVDDIITYTFTVRNTGNVTINNIMVDDPLTGSVDLSITPSTLAPGEEGSATATYAITQTDINLGEVMNSATVIGQDAMGNDIMDVSDNGDETVDDDGDNDPTNDPTITVIQQLPNLALSKIGVYTDTNNDRVPNAGDEIRYTFRVQNTGNVDITNIVLTDPLPGIVIEGGPIDLVAGETDDSSFTAVYVLTEEDLLSGSVTNQATVTGQDPNGIDVIDVSDDPLNDTDVDTDGDGDFEDETITEIGDIFDLDDDIVIYTGISPNGDGINDEFRIVGLNNFPNNVLRIYNRWGVLVFEEDGYEQPGAKSFAGISSGRVTISKKEELPVGTYYYVLDYENTAGVRKSRAGYLYINK
ncbi:gliding motility-associated C-terminal domain-containing protein, partial [Aquimarina sp. AD10]